MRLLCSHQRGYACHSLVERYASRSLNIKRRQILWPPGAMLSQRRIVLCTRGHNANRYLRLRTHEARVRFTVTLSLACTLVTGKWRSRARDNFFSLSLLLISVYNKQKQINNIISVLSCRFIPSSAHLLASTSGRLHSEFVRLLFLQAHRETDRFFTASGVLSAQPEKTKLFWLFQRRQF